MAVYNKHDWIEAQRKAYELHADKLFWHIRNIFWFNAAIEDPSINSFPQVRFWVGPDWLRKPVPVGVVPECLA